jgi:hypothetical protein
MLLKRVPFQMQNIVLMLMLMLHLLRAVFGESGWGQGVVSQL